ncbi:velvet factor [Globomyces pollinis-pini]|nr:velvet factor [Globomyces pollinis-pini]
MEVNYKLQILQQPIRAKVFPLDDKQRRPVDPPPILELIVDGNLKTEINFRAPFLTCMCSLWDEERKVNYTHVDFVRIVSTSEGNLEKIEKVDYLMGSLVSPSYNLIDLNGLDKVYFIFPDISVRKEGKYCLKFTLMDLLGSPMASIPQLTQTKGKIVNEIFSDTFVVQPISEFLGMMESSELAKSLASQGVKLPVRNSHNPRPNISEE